MKACIAGKNYKSEPMSPLKPAVIIIGVIFTVLGVLAPVVGPMIQPMLPF